MLISRTQPTTMHKIKAHTNIEGNDLVDALAKHGRELYHKDFATPYEHAHPTLYYSQKDWWHSMQEKLDKGPIRHLSKQILKHDNEHNLTSIATQTHQIHKWLENDDIDKILSNGFWTNPTIMYKQKTCLIKLCIGQYMDHAQKQLFFDREAFPSRTFPFATQ